MTQSKLSHELKVACEIWHYNELKEPIWFSKLVESLSRHMDKIVVSRSIDTLTDWMIVYGEYGETEKGRAGYCLYIDTHDGGDYRIRDLYEKYWKAEREAKSEETTTDFHGRRWVKHSTGTEFQEDRIR